MLVLYNSPYAVAALVLGLVVTVIGVLRCGARLALASASVRRQARGLRRGETGPLIEKSERVLWHGVALASGPTAIVAAWIGFLGLMREPFWEPAPPLYEPVPAFEWVRPSANAIADSYDRFALPRSASLAERSQDRAR